MTRRRRKQSNPLALAAVLVVALVAVPALLLVVRLLPWLIAAGVVVVVIRYAKRHRAAQRIPGWSAAPAEHPDVTRLRAQNDQLRAALADAQIARDAAWDAAASRPPRPRPAADSDEVTRLIDTPLSGVRRLGN